MTIQIKDSYELIQDGAWYVRSDLHGIKVSASFDSRARAHECMTAMQALSAEEQAKIANGLRPAPGCEFLVARR